MGFNETKDALHPPPNEPTDHDGDALIFCLNNTLKNLGRIVVLSKNCFTKAKLEYGLRSTIGDIVEQGRNQH